MWGLARRIVAVTVAVLLAGCDGMHRYAQPSLWNASIRTPPPDAFRVLARRPDGDSTGAGVVPRPRSEWVAGGVYVWPARVRIRATNAAERDVAALLRAYLVRGGVAAAIVDRRTAADVWLNSSDNSGRIAGARLGTEGYVLRVRRDGVAMYANTAHGLFYALQTLEQVTTHSNRGLQSRAVAIVDWPEYRWRGIHLDVARHFFPVPVIERFIDVAAHYKLNVFHWHLTDDQGWRLQSDRYPALGADGERYSNADVREVVAYAARRYVTVVPEIDLPAHTGAALRAYPNLGCAFDTLCTRGAGLTFARNVVDDTMSEFPSPYLHAGGDEVFFAAFAAQPRFTREMENAVEARGRRLVGWDEIFTPQLSPRTIVMVWRDRRRAVRIVHHGNDVVLASGALYFDGAQGDPAQEPRASRHMSTLENVYDYSMTPPGLTSEDAAHVLGGQANVWTENIATPERLFAMTLPRELALAEVLWTPRERKNFDSFLARLPAQFAWLDAHQYPFRIPNALIALSGGPAVFEAIPNHVQSVEAWTSAPALTVTLAVPLSGATIRYTTDGTTPSATSQLYRRPFHMPAFARARTLRARTFFRGRAGAETECVLRRGSPADMRTRTNFSKSWSALVSP